MKSRYAAIEDSGQLSRYLDLVADLVGELASRGDLTAIVEAALSRIAEAMEAEAASLFLIEGDELVCRASVGECSITGLRMPADAGVVGRTVTTGKPQLVAEASADPDFYASVSRQSGLPARCLLTAPLIVKDRCLGVVELVNKKSAGHAFDARDARILSALAAAAALAVSNAELAEQMVDQARLRRELELAARVQQNLLPADSPEALPVAAINLAARGVSGDFFDYLTLPDGDILFAVADVSGKGMDAALVMTQAVTLFRALGKLQTEPGVLLHLLNGELVARLSMGMFVTMLIGRINPASGHVRFANAGHPPALLIGSQAARLFPAAAPPLGIDANTQIAEYGEIALRLSPDEALYVYTDGATERRMENGQELEIEGLISLIESHHHEPANERLHSIAAALTPEGHLQRDDITLLAVQRPPRVDLAEWTGLAQPSALRDLRAQVRQACERAGCLARIADDIVLAVDEAVQNIIRHVYQGDEGNIRVHLEIEDDALTVEIDDFGPPTDPESCQGRPLDDVRPGGLGVHFMQTLMDSVSYTQPDGRPGNRLVMKRSLYR